MIPKIEFIYDKEYDNIYRELFYLSNSDNIKYPSDEIDIQKYIDDNVTPIWDEYNEIILTRLKEIGVYEWTEKNIPIYIIGSAKGLWSGTTNPMTIAIRKKPEWIIDAIVHELIHYYQFLKRNIFEEFCNHIINLYKIENINNAMHIILYAMQYKIYNNIPGQREYSLEVLNKQNDLYKGYINKVLEIGIDNIIEIYKDFMQSKKFIAPKKEIILQYVNSNSYSNVFNKTLSHKDANFKQIEELRTGKNIEDFRIGINKDNYKILSQIPEIISKITKIDWIFQYIKIHLVPNDPYDINIPMTIGLYNNENNIEELSIKKIVKYFIYYHKEQLKQYLQNNNLNEVDLEDHLIEATKKELSIITLA